MLGFVLFSCSSVAVVFSLFLFVTHLSAWIEDDFCVDNQRRELYYHGTPVMFVLALAVCVWISCAIADYRCERYGLIACRLLTGFAVVLTIVLPAVRAGKCGWAFSKALHL